MPTTLEQLLEIFKPIHTRVLLDCNDGLIKPLYEGLTLPLKRLTTSTKKFKVITVDYEPSTFTAIVLVDLLSKKEVDMIEKINANWRL